MSEIYSEGRALALLVILSVTVLAGAGGSALSSQTASPEPTVTITDTTVDPGETATVTIGLSVVPFEVAGYSLEVTRSGTAANISTGEYPETFEVTEPPTLSSDNGAISLAALNLKGAPAETDKDLVLATVTVAGSTPGTTSLTVNAVQIDGVDGDRIQPTSTTGTITVESVDSANGDSSSNDAGGRGGSDSDSGP